MLTPISTAVRSYYTVVRAGNISFRVALDTASSDLWLLSSTCSSNACKNIPTYPLSYPSPSFTTVNNNETAFNLSFADGSGEPAINNCVGVALMSPLFCLVSSGFLAEEFVQLENFSLPHQVIGKIRLYCITGQFSDLIIGLVNTTNVTLTNQISGVLGMGFPRLSLFSSLAVNGMFHTVK